MDSTAVTILLPIYNAERYLFESLKSLSEQTFPRFRVIMIDDASEDRSREIAASFCSFDPRFLLLTRRQNVGWVKGLKEASTLVSSEFIARQDADDVSLSRRLERQVEFLAANPHVVALGTQAHLVDMDGLPIGSTQLPLRHEDIQMSLLHCSWRHGHLLHPSVMMRTAAFREVGGYDTKLAASEDRDLWLRLSEIGELAALDVPLVKYRLHSSSVTYARSASQLAHAKLVVDNARARRGLAPDPTTTVPSVQSKWRQHAKWALIAVENGYIATAKKHARRAFALAPFRRLAWRAALRAHFSQLLR